MSIQIEYTEAGDLLIRCGNDTMVWPLASALRAAMAVGAGSPVAPTPSPAPSITPAPAPAPSTAAPPPKPPKIGYPPPLPGAMTFIVSRRSNRGLQTYPWFAADWPAASGLEIPLEQLQQEHPELLLRDLHDLQANRPVGPAGRCLTIFVPPSSLHAPLDVGRLQWLADEPSLGLEGVRLQFGAPDAGESR